MKTINKMVHASEVLPDEYPNKNIEDFCYYRRTVVTSTFEAPSDATHKEICENLDLMARDSLHKTLVIRTTEKRITKINL